MATERKVPSSMGVAEARSRDWKHILRLIPDGLSMQFVGDSSQHVRFATTPWRDMQSMRKSGGGWVSAPLSTLGEVARWLDSR